MKTVITNARRTNFITQLSIPTLPLVLATIFCVLLIPQAKAQNASMNSKELLRMLDTELNHSHDYAQQKEERILRLKSQLAQSHDDEEHYWLKRRIASEYSTYDSDSALKYGTCALELAERLNRFDLVNDTRVDLSYTLTAMGLLSQARRQLEAVDTAYLTPRSRIDYLGQLVFYLTHEEQYKRANVTYSFPDDAQVILDSICSIITPEHPEYYYYIGYQAQNKEPLREHAIDLLTEHLRRSKFDTHTDAKEAWTLAQLYGWIGKEEEKKRYLALSAIADMRVANRDIASIEELASMEHAENNLDRAMTYIGYCLECAELYKNRVRALRLATLQTEISKSSQAQVARLQVISWIAYGLGLILIVSLIASLFYIRKQREALKQSNRQLADVNTELKDKLTELSQAYSKLAERTQQQADLAEDLRVSNDKLAQSDAGKERSLGQMISISSSIIHQIDDFRRTISRKLKAKQVDDVRRLVDTPDLPQSIVKDFYQKIDQLVFEIFPDFVEQFNTLMEPGNEIIPKEGQLNTDLRIYALVRLGITDSVTIAEVLHCSPQTVYNKRQKVRTASRLDRTAFVEAVKGLCRYSK